MEIHEAATIFPLDEENIAELANDIRINGLKVPIEQMDGKVIDGRRRLRACEIAGVKPRFHDVTVDDPVSYVLSLNLHRRHLTPSQKSMIAARVRELYAKQAKERQIEAGKTHGRGKVPVTLPEPIKGDSRDHAGKAVGVCGKLVDRAAKVIKSAVPEVVAAVDEGRMSVTAAAILSNEPEEIQREEATKPKQDRTYQSVNGTQERKTVSAPEMVEGEVNGVGVLRAHEAIAILKRIPKNDQLRSRGLQVVMEWIRKER